MIASPPCLSKRRSHPNDGRTTRIPCRTSFDLFFQVHVRRPAGQPSSGQTQFSVPRNHRQARLHPHQHHVVDQAHKIQVQ